MSGKAHQRLQDIQERNLRSLTFKPTQPLQFASTGPYCEICGKPRNKKIHAKCSKKKQAISKLFKEKHSEDT